MKTEHVVGSVTKSKQARQHCCNRKDIGKFDEPAGYKHEHNKSIIILL